MGMGICRAGHRKSFRCPGDNLLMGIRRYDNAYEPNRPSSSDPKPTGKNGRYAADCTPNRRAARPIPPCPPRGGFCAFCGKQPRNTPKPCVFPAGLNTKAHENRRNRARKMPCLNTPDFRIPKGFRTIHVRPQGPSMNFNVRHHAAQCWWQKQHGTGRSFCRAPR